MTRRLVTPLPTPPNPYPPRRHTGTTVWDFLICVAVLAALVLLLNPRDNASDFAISSLKGSWERWSVSVTPSPPPPSPEMLDPEPELEMQTEPELELGSELKLEPAAPEPEPEPEPELKPEPEPEPQPEPQPDPEPEPEPEPHPEPEPEPEPAAIGGAPEVNCDDYADLWMRARCYAAFGYEFLGDMALDIWGEAQDLFRKMWEAAKAMFAEDQAMFAESQAMFAEGQWLWRERGGYHSQEWVRILNGRVKGGSYY